MELLTLKQSDSIEDYRKQFEQLVYHIKLFDRTVSETFLVSQFVLGLKDELRSAVDMQLPNTMVKAATLAAVQESLLGRNKKSYSKAMPTKSFTPPAKVDTTSPFSAGELWKSRQLREFRKQNGLCYKCGEKFNPGHKCKQPASPQLNFIAVEGGGDGGVILSDELLDVFESPQNIFALEDVFVSLNAITGTEKSKLIKF